MSKFYSYKSYVDHIAQRFMDEDITYKVDAADVEKPGNHYYGLRFHLNDNMGVCIDMNDEYKNYLDGKEIQDTVNELKDMAGKEQIKANCVNTAEIIKDFDDYQRMKHRLVIEAVNYTNNEDLLDEVPHKTVGDIACTYRVVLNDFNDDEKRIGFLVTNAMLEGWNVDENQLHRDAVENSMKVSPIELRNFKEMGLNGAPFTVCTNPIQRDGASVMFYDNFAKELQERGIEDCYIIPSSVHEVLVCPKEKDIPPGALASMLIAVNETQVSEEEFLANHIVEYDSATKEFFPVMDEPLDLKMAC